ncbi:cell division protein [Clostridium sardiniense]|uniref:cell division protein n=1 Tax=Clostridium sardiniense TaxID=29369 RepID=UPI003D32C22F
MKKIGLSNFIPLIIASPAVIIGVIAMKTAGVSAITFGQNLAYLIIGGLISGYIVSRDTKIKKNSNSILVILITIILLGLTFIDKGIYGIHRWVAIGPIKFYVTSIILPITIIELWNLLQRKKWMSTVVITLLILVILSIQPDASQLTAFSITIIIIFWNKLNRKIVKVIVSGILLILNSLSWIYLDALNPVPYVEQIVSLVGNMGSIWFVLGIISLIILPLPFILFPAKRYKLLSRGIGIYFILILISTIFGNFPVPLMGYGVSPMIGYFIAITWFVKSKIYPQY